MRWRKAHRRKVRQDELQQWTPEKIERVLQGVAQAAAYSTFVALSFEGLNKAFARVGEAFKALCREVPQTQEH